MTITINVNGLSMCHKGSEGFVRSTLPGRRRSPNRTGDGKSIGGRLERAS